MLTALSKSYTYLLSDTVIILGGGRGQRSQLGLVALPEGRGRREGGTEGGREEGREGGRERGGKRERG